MLAFVVGNAPGHADTDGGKEAGLFRRTITARLKSPRPGVEGAEKPVEQEARRENAQHIDYQRIAGSQQIEGDQDHQMAMPSLMPGMPTLKGMRASM